MDSNYWRGKEPSDWRNDGGILSGPSAPFHFIFLMADNNSSIWSGSFIISRWCIELFFELTVEVLISLWHVKFANPGHSGVWKYLLLVMVWWLLDIASFGELVSGVPFRPWMTCHIFEPSDFEIASWRRSFQLSPLVLLIASVASLQASMHSCWFFGGLSNRGNFEYKF